MVDISNSHIPQNSTPTKITDAVKAARTSYNNSKDGAAKAAAHAYMIWLDTQSPNAALDMRRWFSEQIEQINNNIKKHNQNEEALKDRAKRFANNTLKNTDLLMKKAETEGEKKEQEADKKKLQEASAFTDKEWRTRRMIPLEMHGNEIDFLVIVKYALNLMRSSETSVASRYAKVLEWIHAKFEHEFINDTDQIVLAIKQSGGFEEVLDIQRNINTESNTEEEAEDRKIQAEAILKEAKAAVAKAVAVSAFNMPVHNSPSGIVTLLGRYTDGQVEIVGELPLEEEELDRLLSSYEDEKLMPTNPSSEFVYRALTLGELVLDGEKTNFRVDGLSAGKFQKSERLLTLVLHSDGGLKLVISAQYADASVIVKATPNKELELGAVETPVYLDVKARRNLQKIIRNRPNRRLVTISPLNDADGLKWKAGDRALIAAKRVNSMRTYLFKPVAELDVKPLDVDNFKPVFKVSLTSAEIARMYNDGLADWGKDVSGKKGQKQMSLTFKGSNVILKVEGKNDLTLNCAGQPLSPKTLSFRPRDLHDLVKAIKEQHTQSFEMSGDKGDMLCVKWSDSLGNYEVYLPTSKADGALNMRRVAQMSCDEQLSDAA